ncbi:MAG: hypothetical protein J6A52_00090 [Bacilli bacterium]|nr:hypothetical protein [Bacilli bacterium]
MNYNEYDSDGNKKSFDFSLLFTDKKYRSRLVLGIYAIVFIILITMIRLGGNSTNQTLQSDNKVENNIEENIPDNVESEEIDNFKEEFSYIYLNNYNFEYSLLSDEQEFIAFGKRYENKHDFNFTNQIDTIHYLSNGKKVMALEPDKEYYVLTNLPFYYINYFESEKINKILNESTKVSENVYEISNLKLIDFVEPEYRSELNDEQLNNTITLTKKNNIIVALEIDITNLVNGLGNENNSTIISLKYSNFNLIDDFEINF